VDQYTATSVDEGYIEGVQRYFTRLTTSSWVKLKTVSGLVDGETGQYLYESNISGTCPACSREADGNICEECGEPNVVTDLGEPRSRLSQSVPKRVDTERYTLPLHEFANMIADQHRIGRVPARVRELAHRIFTRRDIIDLPVSHPSRWGVRPAEATLSDQVIWVWVEMTYGFLRGIERLGAKIGGGWSSEAPQKDWKIVHFLGYDNSFYHAILHPVLYRIAFPEWKPDIDYHLNEFYLLDEKKFSTSRRHAIWGQGVLSPETVDAIRYYLCSTRPENQRTNFIRAEFDRVVSDVLVGQWEMWLTSLGRRVSEQYGGNVPDAGTWTTEATVFLSLLSLRLEEITAALNPEGFSLRRAAAVLNCIVVDVREFSSQQSRLTGLDRWSSEARTAIALELAAARLLAHISAPLMPRFSARLAVAIGIPKISSWPKTVELVKPGSQCTLAETHYFVVKPEL
jgi:methionyl-tRNA synthetase